MSDLERFPPKRFVVLRYGEWWEWTDDLDDALERADRFIGGEVYDRVEGKYLSPEGSEAGKR